MWIIWIAGVIAAFVLGGLYGQRVKAAAIAKEQRDAAGLRGAIQRVESTLREKL